MGIKGFQGTSLLDFPGRIASLVFFGGCNLTCPYCHNPSLVLDPDQHEDIPAAALLEEIRERRSFIDGVVVTGGEPTLDAGLLPFLRELKALGLEVKLDTNGLAPVVLEQALAEKLVDFVALDLKTAPHRYGELHRRPVNPSALGRSVRLLLDSGHRVRAAHHLRAGPGRGGGHPRPRRTGARGAVLDAAAVSSAACADRGAAGAGAASGGEDSRLCRAGGGVCG